MIKSFSEIFKVLGQETRLKIIKLLHHKEFCVCELEEILNMSQSAVSQHIRVLKYMGLVKELREGKWIFYSLDKKNYNSFINDFNSIMKEDIFDLENILSEEKEIIKYLEENPKVSCRPIKKEVK